MKKFAQILILLLCLPVLVVTQDFWEEITIPDTAILYDFAFDTTGYLYIGTNKGVYFSENENQWQFIGPTYFSSYVYINDNNTIYAGMNELYRSYDNGLTWDSIFFSSQGGITSFYTIGDSTLLLGTWGGIYRSNDNGLTWIKVLELYLSEVIRDITSNSSGVFFAGSTSFGSDVSPGGIYMSEDYGLTWQLSGLFYHFVSSIVINSNDEIFVGTRGHATEGGGGIFKSIDGGENWNKIYSGNLVASMNINIYDEIAIGCATQGYPGGIFCSYDNGDNWTEITDGLPLNSIEKVLFKPDNYLYAMAHYEGRLFKTDIPVKVANNYINNTENIFTVLPNPSHQKITLELYGQHFGSISITDLSGRLIKKVIPTQNNHTLEIDISDLEPAVYLVIGKGKHGASVAKFVKM